MSKKSQKEIKESIDSSEDESYLSDESDKSTDKSTDKSVRWSTLRHNGILFPEAYKPLPKNICILYDNKPIVLDSINTKNKFNLTAEEAMLFLAQKIEQDNRLCKTRADHTFVMNDSVFVQNFWNDWKCILGKGSVIKNIKKIDFTPVVNYVSKLSEERKEQRKNLTKEEKLEKKRLLTEQKNIYGYAYLDDVKIPVQTYMVQPPGLFIGHGDSPLRGKLKKRMKPSDITLNISKEYIPKCMYNGVESKWGDIVQRQDSTWIGYWDNPVNGNKNYFHLSRIDSHFVYESDKQKFDKACMLEKNIKKVRTRYMQDIKSEDVSTRQLATAVYLLDQLAIRPGTEKDETKEAGTLGLTTLKRQNITFLPDSTITIDFVGKSSIKFVKTVKINSIAYKNLKSTTTKAKNSLLFPLVNAISLNKYLKSLLPDLTSKVFRTWKASSLLQQELLKNIPDINDPVHVKKMVYDKVNIDVALALNHKRMTSNEAVCSKLENEIKTLETEKEEAKTDKQALSKQKAIDEKRVKLIQAQGNVATSTSKVNYMDPRISVAWAKTVEFPIEKIYGATQLRKFVWSMDTKSDWRM